MSQKKAKLEWGEESEGDGTKRTEKT